jgi:hypothetical protein
MVFRSGFDSLKTAFGKPSACVLVSRELRPLAQSTGRYLPVTAAGLPSSSRICTADSLGVAELPSDSISPGKLYRVSRAWDSLLFLGFCVSAELQGKTRQPRRMAAEFEPFSDSCRGLIFE